jgi:uncharacterized protein (DUF433 family)
MNAAARNHLSMRVRPGVLRGIEREARRTGRPPTTLAADMLEEGLIMRMYPGIGFRDGAGGRRPALLGHRIDVHQVVETVKASRGNLDKAAAYFDVPVGLVRSAIEYYADNAGDVDDWITRQAEQARDAERRWRAGQAASQE